MSNEEKAKLIIDALNDYGRDFDSYDYGLPTYNGSGRGDRHENPLDEMTNIIMQILDSQ